MNCCKYDSLSDFEAAVCANCVSYNDIVCEHKQAIQTK